MSATSFTFASNAVRFTSKSACSVIIGVVMDNLRAGRSFIVKDSSICFVRACANFSLNFVGL